MAAGCHIGHAREGPKQRGANGVAWPQRPALPLALHDRPFAIGPSTGQPFPASSRRRVIRRRRNRRGPDDRLPKLRRDSGRLASEMPRLRLVGRQTGDRRTLSAGGFCQAAKRDDPARISVDGGQFEHLVGAAVSDGTIDRQGSLPCRAWREYQHISGDALLAGISPRADSGLALGLGPNFCACPSNRAAGRRSAQSNL